MGTITFVDMFLYIKKRIRTIIAFALVGAILGLILAVASQTYTATMGLEYSYDGASDQLDPLGGTLNVYEIMKPSLIATALKDMDSELSVEDVRNRLSVSPVVKTTDTEAQQAKIALGETVDVTTTNYTVSYTCPGSLGSEFAQHFLFELLKVYDDQFSQEYLQMNRVADFMGVVDVDSMDYMEKCDYIYNSLGDIISKLDHLVDQNSEFTSTQTGLDFAALRSLYVNLRDNQYQRLYANVRKELLTVNRELLIQGYQKKIEDMQLSQKNNEDESALAHDLVLTFYDQYKKNNLYYQARSTQLETDNSDNDNKNLVYDYDLSLMINTYDDIMLRYVNTGVAATDLTHEIEYYESLIDAFSAAPSMKSQAAQYEAADAQIAQIAEISASYADLANRTLEDYYRSMIADNVKYMTAVEVTANVSSKLYIAIGMFLMAAVGCAFVIVVESMKKQIAQRNLTQLQFNGDGTLSVELIENMTPLEKAFYDQYIDGFDEFYLMYQPMVRENRWAIAETLVRWKSARFGQIMPEEFLAIAEKYKLMDRLGEWILRQVCEQSKAWQKGGVVSPAISVNYSVQQIESQLFIDSICSIILESGVDPANIYLEISGGGEIRNLKPVINKFVALKALNLCLAIDRFGDAISSLRVLYDLPSDMIKLDRCILNALRDENSKEASFLNQVLSICKERNLDICACGVEEPWQATELTKLGVLYQQGFYYASPLLVADYEQRCAALAQSEAADSEPANEQEV